MPRHSHRITFNTKINQWDSATRKSIPSGDDMIVSGVVYRYDGEIHEDADDVQCDVDSIIWDGKEVCALFRSLDQMDDICEELQQKGFEYFQTVSVTQHLGQFDSFRAICKILNPHSNY